MGTHAATDATDAPVAAVARPRDAYIDNLKAVLIVLVIAGHTLEKVAVGAPGADIAYTWIYLFHMPAFAVLSGMLTSTYVLDGRRVRSMVVALLIPLAIFQLLYMGLYELNDRGDGWTVDAFLTPLYQLWFLAALFVWRFTTPILVRLRGVLAIAVVISLGAGLAVELDRFLSLARIAGFLPFFVAGLLLGRGRLATPATRWWRLAAGALLIAAIPVALAFHDRLAVPWLYWDRAYSELGFGAWSGSGVRLLMIGIGAAMTWCVFVLVPRRRSWATNIGEHSMYPYLLHAFVVLGVGWNVLGGEVTEAWQVVLLLALTVLLAAVLASRPVRWLFRPLVEPRAAWLFRRDTSVS